MIEQFIRIVFGLKKEGKTVSDTISQKDNALLFLILVAASVITFFTGMWFLAVFTTIGFLYIGFELLFPGKSKVS